MPLLEMLRNLLPGGKLASLDIADIIMTLRSEFGPICKLKGFLGRPDTIFTHNLQDIENFHRNQGVWPNRPGIEIANYHRTVHRADFFEDAEGLVAS